MIYYDLVPEAQRGAFARQMEHLWRQAQLWTLDALVPRASRWIGLGLDYAYESVWENTVLELQRLGIPFTVFMPIGSLGQRSD